MMFLRNLLRILFFVLVMAVWVGCIFIGPILTEVGKLNVFIALILAVGSLVGGITLLVTYEKRIDKYVRFEQAKPAPEPEEE